jgi:membrane-associated phospholipid phosphatase
MVHRGRVRRLAVLLAVLAASSASAATAPLDPAVARGATVPRPRLRLSGAGAAMLAGGAAAAWSLAAATDGSGRPGACRWCEPTALDRGAREALRWSDPAAAGDASDALRLAVPLGSAAAVAWLAARDGGGFREALEDVLAVGAALAITAPLASAVKHGTARLRPRAWEAGGARGERDLHSFYSGHASLAFAAAAAATQVARLRGRAGWRWLGAATFGAAAATAWLRVAADQHWATDALAGAGAGTLVGLAAPPLVLRRRAGAESALEASLAPAPGGLAIVF